jgi:hypothetical protein
MTAVLRRTTEILQVVYRGEARREHEVWTDSRAGLALIQIPSQLGGDDVPMHCDSREAFAYSGFVSAAQYSASAVRRLIAVGRRGRLTLEDSPGGIAAFFFADVRSRRGFAWASHAGVEGVFHTKGEECIALSNSPLVSHLIGLQRDVPRFSSLWARRVLLGGNTLWDDTPYEQTFHAPPRSMLVVDEDVVRRMPHPVPLERHRFAEADEAGPEAVNAAAHEAISVLRRWPQAVVQLSGGKDSRYVGAALRRARIDARYVTFSGAFGEGAAASAVASALGIELEITESPGIDTGEALLPTVLNNLRRSDGMLGENRQLAYRALTHRGEPLVQGQAHHPRGGYRVRSTRKLDVMKAALRASAMGDQDLVVDELVRERRERLEQIMNDYRARYAPDLAYWLYNDWRMGRWTIAGYRAMSRSRPVVWPMMDERVLRVLSELASFDRVSEVAFFAALRRLSPEVAAVPIYENLWKFDHGDIGPTRFPDGFEARRQPFKTSGTGRTPERRASTIQPLFRIATQDLVYSDELRSLIQPDVLQALCEEDDPSVRLGRPYTQLVMFMWKAVAIALVIQGDWLSAARP